ncbi:methyltransferase domain-containing protein [Amycolatopsis circi]|uniref:methyltransferase domain-containing protein n=1 Tax=Amycolatopsis circi TaxID=871959 RepID=UPI003CC6210A
MPSAPTIAAYGTRSTRSAAPPRRPIAPAGFTGVARRARQGSAESIPLPDASVDAVLSGNAMHWFDMEAVGPEIAIPGGRHAGPRHQKPSPRTSSHNPRRSASPER